MRRDFIILTPIPLTSSPFDYVRKLAPPPIGGGNKSQRWRASGAKTAHVRSAKALKGIMPMRACQRSIQPIEELLFQTLAASDTSPVNAKSSVLHVSADQNRWTGLSQWSPTANGTKAVTPKTADTEQPPRQLSQGAADHRRHTSRCLASGP